MATLVRVILDFSRQWESETDAAGPVSISRLSPTHQQWPQFPIRTGLHFGCLGRVTTEAGRISSQRKAILNKVGMRRILELNELWSDLQI
jgi:hypothetical protein